MKSTMKTLSFTSALVIAMAGACLSKQTLAGEPHEVHEVHEVHRHMVELDDRYHHDRYYPVRGYVVDRVPVGSIHLSFGASEYYFHAGVWFHALGGHFVVVTPPVGITIPALPPGCVSLLIGGLPYYYANGVYYARAAGAGYTVVEAPPGADSAQALAAGAPVAAASTPAAVSLQQPASDPIIYPKSGQSAAQADLDLTQCKNWASSQPGASPNSSTFSRALDACLDGRGYSVR